MTSHILPQLNAQQIIEFWGKIAITDNPDECWVWTLSTKDSGHGRVRIDWIEYKPHRIAYFLHTGHDPKELRVCHHCDNPPCCNPKHLYAGTQKNNCEDRERRGRGNQPKGVNNAFAKLNDDKVRELRRKFANGEANKTQLAKEYGIACNTVKDIVRRRWWTHVE